MVVYWSACVCSMLFAWFGIRVKHKKRDIWYYLKLSFFAALPLIFISSIRYDVGRDYLYTYVPYFEKVQRGVATSKMEPLYHLLNVVVAVLGGSYPWVFAVSAIVFMTAVFYRFFKDSPDVYLSIFLLLGTTYLFIFFNGMRQMIGCSILLCALKYARERRLVPFLGIVAVASCIHWSCLVFIPFYFLSNIRFKPIAVIAATVCVIAGTALLSKMIYAVVMHTKYAVYVGSVLDTSEQGLVVLSISIVVLLFATIFRSNEPTYNQYYNLQMISTWLCILNGEIVLINRVNFMFGLPVCILIPLALKNIRDARYRFILKTIIVCLYFVYVTYTIGIQNGNSVLPYQTIFSVL